MNELLNKISSYNIFNYLFPGAIFAILTSGVIKYPIDETDVLARLFLYYFVGLLISRVGSVIIEPFLKRVRFIQFKPYKDYIKASSRDPKIELLSEVNNTYRTLSALFAILLGVELATRRTPHPFVGHGWLGAIGLAALLIMFLLSYRKQTGYITQRVEANS